MRIFPMTLRVSGYSKPPEPDATDRLSSRELESLVWKLPVIHVEGESKGSDMDSSVIRQVKGTVRMIGDGAVRWSLVITSLLHYLSWGAHNQYPDFEFPWRRFSGVGNGRSAGWLYWICSWDNRYASRPEFLHRKSLMFAVRYVDRR